MPIRIDISEPKQTNMIIIVCTIIQTYSGTALRNFDRDPHRSQSSQLYSCFVHSYVEVHLQPFPTDINQQTSSFSIKGCARLSLMELDRRGVLKLSLMELERRLGELVVLEQTLTSSDNPQKVEMLLTDRSTFTKLSYKVLITKNLYTTDAQFKR